MAEEPMEMAGVNVEEEIPFEYYKINRDEVRRGTNPKQ